jgi:hypothetical protein
LHASDVRLTEDTVIDPAVPELASDAPAADAANTFMTPMAPVVAPGVRVRDAMATMPFAIVVALSPYATQSQAPGAALQAIDFPAAVADAPAETVILATVAAE